MEEKIVSTEVQENVLKEIFILNKIEWLSYLKSIIVKHQMQRNLQLIILYTYFLLPT